MGKLSTVQNGGFPNIFSFHIIHYTLFSSLKNICNKKDFHVARQTCWWKRPFHVGCQDKSGPGKIPEVILVSALFSCGEIRFAEFAEKAVSYFVWWGNLFRILCISLHARHEEGEDDKSDTRRVSMPAAQVVYTHRLGGCSYWLAFVGLRKIAQIVSLWNQWIQQAIWWRICTHNKSCFQCFDFVVVVVVFFGWEEEPRVWVSWLKNLRDVTGCSRIRHLPDGVILLLWPE